MRFPRTPPLTDQTPPGLLLLGQPLRHQFGVSRLILLIPQHARHLGGLPGPLTLQGERGDESLNLGRLTNGLPGLVGEGPGNDVLEHVVLLVQVEQLANLVGALGPQTTGHRIVGETGDGTVPDLDDGEVEHGNVVGHDASPNGLAFAFPGASLAVALVPLVHEQPDAVIAEDALSHGEALLVVAARDAHDVARELLAQDGSVDFLGHAALVQVLEALLVVDFDDLLEARGGDGDVDLLEVMAVGVFRWINS